MCAFRGSDTTTTEVGDGIVLLCGCCVLRGMCEFTFCWQSALFFVAAEGKCRNNVNRGERKKESRQAGGRANEGSAMRCLVGGWLMSTLMLLNWQ